MAKQKQSKKDDDNFWIVVTLASFKGKPDVCELEARGPFTKDGALEYVVESQYEGGFLSILPLKSGWEGKPVKVSSWKSSVSGPATFTIV